MATMVLKDMIICPECGAKMFPSSFDKENRIIGYKCCSVSCGFESKHGFDEVKLADDERFSFFCLNDDGDATWKCYEHGYCDYTIDALIDMDYTKFENCCCILGRDVDEIEADFEFAQSEGREKIRKILDAIGEERATELADSMIYENPIEMFDGDYVEAFVAEAICSMDGTESFILDMIDRIYDLFEISIDEEGNITEEDFE